MHGCLYVVSVECCQVEVSATTWSLVQKGPTDCGVRVTECNLQTSTTRAKSTAVVQLRKINPLFIPAFIIICFVSFFFTYLIFIIIYLFTYEFIIYLFSTFIMYLFTCLLSIYFFFLCVFIIYLFMAHFTRLPFAHTRAPNGKSISKQWTGKDMEWIDRRLTWAAILSLVWRDWGTVAYRGGVQTPTPEIPKAPQNCAKPNPTVKTVKNCWI